MYLVPVMASRSLLGILLSSRDFLAPDRSSLNGSVVGVGDQDHETSACGALLVVRCASSCIRTATLLLDMSGALIALQLFLV